MKREHGANRPSRLIVTNRSQPRLDEIRAFHEKLDSGVPVEYLLAPSAEVNDAACRRLRPGSLVANATGLGKDAPGSPLTDSAVFPEDGFVWEFNYRGELVFLRQARAQQAERRLRVEDGWIYFIHGWTRGIAEVFHVDIPVRGPAFDELSRIAAAAR
jgi:shikimate 5-dehydrogenase